MISFGHRIEPLVDDYLIDTMTGMRFVSNTPQNRGKVICFENVWEGAGSLGLTAFEDEENIKLYYRGYPRHKSDDESSFQTSCISVSAKGDGLHFVPYPVNEIDYRGVTENNIVKMDSICHNFAPFYDTNPNCHADERYKAIGGKKQDGGIFVFVSADGIHWKPLVDHAVITKGAFDSMNMAFWDDCAKLYRCYSRYYDNSIRAIQSCVSSDFIHWDAPIHNRYEDGITDQLYTNATRTIPGAEHILISLPMRYNPTRKKVPEHGGSDHWSFDGASDMILMTSRDGVFWDRTLKDAWLAGSTYLHEWTERNFITCGGIIQRKDEFLFYIEKNYRWEDCGIWAYSVPKYRFMSLYADSTEGQMVTKLLAFDSDDIYLNFSTSACGYVVVQVLDEDGNVRYISDELYGNEISAPLHIEGLKGTVGRMVFRLKEANLYAIGSDMNKII